MVQLPSRDEMPASEPTDTGWSYWRPGLDGVVEVGEFRGRDVGLPTHFHGEDKITFVVSGRRRFLIGGEVITLVPGQGALIPAGIAHRSLAEPCGVACLNVYVPAGEYAVAAMMRDAERLWTKAGHIRCTELAAVVHEHRRGAGGCTPASSAVPADATCLEPVSRAAARVREGAPRRVVPFPPTRPA